MCLTPTAQATYFIVTLILMKSLRNIKNVIFTKASSGKPSGSAWHLISTISHKCKWTVLCWPTFHTLASAIILKKQQQQAFTSVTVSQSH